MQVFIIRFIINMHCPQDNHIKFQSHLLSSFAFNNMPSTIKFIMIMFGNDQYINSIRLW